MVAGMIEEGETIEAVARREAMEEAVDQAAPDRSSVTRDSEEPASAYLIFLVVKWTPRPRQVIHGLADETKIFVRVVSREQAYQWVEEGKSTTQPRHRAFAMASVASSRVKNECSTVIHPTSQK